MPVVTEEQQKTRRQRLWPAFLALVGAPTLPLALLLLAPWVHPFEYQNDSFGVRGHGIWSATEGTTGKDPSLLGVSEQLGNMPGRFFRYGVYPLGTTAGYVRCGGFRLGDAVYLIYWR